MACSPYTPNYACCDSWHDLNNDLRTRSEALAWGAMRFLTAGLVGACPVVLRPCSPMPCGACGDAAGGPYIRDGVWYSNWCGTAGDCSCDPLSVVTLPGRVAEVTSVSIDGQALPSTAWRLDNGNTVVRTDGGSFPSCQDMAVGADEVGAFAITYVPGVKPDEAGLWAVGVLACEFSKACSGEKCRLPASVTTVARQGVTMSFDNAMFSNGQTGIREVDAYVLSVNPNRLRVPARVWSPDVQRGFRYTGA